METLTFNTVGALGIGVSDLKRSVDFYIRVVGMKQLINLTLPDMDEVILGYSGARGAALVLMHWTDGSARNYQDNPVKVVLYVADPTALAASIREAGFEVTREPEPVPELGGIVVGFARDPDGYVLEILQASNGKAPGSE
jgi:lactoylglutathione lyase